MASLEDFIKLVIDEALKDIEITGGNDGYIPSENYIGPEGIWWLRYPRRAPFGKYLNRPAYRHDRRFDRPGFNRTTHSNLRMRDDFAVEMLLDGRSPAGIYFLTGMAFFYSLILPLITIGGRYID